MITLKGIFASMVNRKNLPVIIAGAGIVGKVLLSVCRDMGIDVACFCDNSKKVGGTEFCGLEVIYTPNLKERHKDAIFLISAASIKDVIDLLCDLGFSNWYAGGLLLKDFDVSQNSSDASLDYAKYAVENCILCHDGYLNPDKLFLRSIDIIITERCSLKCEKCSNLMQYYVNPQNCDTNMLLKSIDAFCMIADEVMDFRIIGGEPFMNKEWHIIAERLINEPKAKRAVIYTNGTIIPDGKYLDILKNNKALVIISDYGVLSKNLSGLKKALEERKISHHVFKITEWLDCSDITRHNRGFEGNQEIFKLCCAKNMASLSDGKLFRCPYSANAERLSAVPNCFSGDYFNLFDELFYDGFPVEELQKIKSKLRSFLLAKDFLETCDYCSGRPLSGVEVKPNVQINKPLEYRRY